MEERLEIMRFVGIDVGTTHCKAGLFDASGKSIAMASGQTPYQDVGGGHVEIEPEELWQVVLETLREILPENTGQSVTAIGITSMAEAGFLMDKQTKQPRTRFIPWFDDRPRFSAHSLMGPFSPLERFQRSGLHPGSKWSLPKILWLRSLEPGITEGAVWIGAGDYIAYRLTGKIATDYTLATRTYCFRLDTRNWDEKLLGSFDLDPSLFPPAYPSGQPLGFTLEGENWGLNLSPRATVCVSGHDHPCAALAVGATRPGVVYDSMGTAETLMGTLTDALLSEKDYDSGFSYGCHVLPDRLYWMGALSSSGGSIEWLRSIMGEEPLSYQRIDELLSESGPEPSGIIYLPYLAGSGAPWPDVTVQGAFVGLLRRHNRGHLLKAVLEGTAYEIEAIRQTAEAIVGSAIDQIIAVGGGTRNKHWLQIKADVSGCEYIVPPVAEATLLGAALVAALGCGALEEEQIVDLAKVQNELGTKVSPYLQRHVSYEYWYEKAFLALQEPLRSYYNAVVDERG